MARRKGSGRGKSAVNARKSALENSRDDPGGTQRHQHNLSNMEAATTTTTATSKHYNKTKLQTNHRSVERGGRGANATTSSSSISRIISPATTAAYNKKQNNNTNSNNANVQPQTYRSTNSGTVVGGVSAAGGSGSSGGSETNVVVSVGAKTTQKQTVKQTKAAIAAAAKLATAAAAAAALAATISTGDSSTNTDPLAINSSVDVDNVVHNKLSASTSSKSKDKTEQKTATKVSPTKTTAMTTELTEVTLSSNIISSHNTTTTTTTTTTTSNNSSNNKNISDNSSNSLNKNYTLSISDNSNKEKFVVANNNKINSNNNHEGKDSDNVATNATASTTKRQAPSNASETATSSWNNSRYLHKKFKRVASTTEADTVDGQSCGGVAGNKEDDIMHNKMRNASISSSSASSISSPPPSSTNVAPITATTQQITVDSKMPVSSSSMSVLPLEYSNVAAASRVQQQQPNLQSAIIEDLITTNGQVHQHHHQQQQQQQQQDLRHETIATAAATVAIANNANYQTQQQLALHNPPPQNVANAISNSSLLLPTISDNVKYTNSSANNNSNNNNSNINKSSSNNASASVPVSSTSTTATEPPQNSNSGTTIGRHVCPYCNLNCTKPSVLQKHIRAHTNERPFPCDICSIAFKTKSNFYKHCRSRSHAARKRGIEVPADADDGLFGGSDQEGDPELSNSSSDVISRNASPLLDERSISSPAALPNQTMQQQQHLPLAMQHVVHGNIAASPSPSPSSISASKTTYFQQQPPQLPLGSPAAGTLPPAATATVFGGGGGNINMVAAAAGSSHSLQSVEFKPYKPKFHNASLYVSTKDTTSAKQQQHQHLQHQFTTQQHIEQQKLSSAPHLQQQQSAIHHPTLSPSTQVKLNNHINTHQLQLQQQQQQQQQQRHHVMPNALPPMTAAAAGVYYLSQPPPPPVGATLMHPAAHIQQHQYYNPIAAAHQAQAFAFHMLTPQQQQQLHHQIQLQQQHLQQQQQLQIHNQQQQQQQLPQQQPQLQIHNQQQQPQQQQHSSAAAPILKTNVPTSSSSLSHQQRHSNLVTAQSPAPNAPPQQQAYRHYHANVATGSAAGGGNSGSSSSSSATIATNSNILSNAGTSNSNISNSSAAATSTGAALLNKEYLQEHISKLISQNEAIVENKELLLQKKYPKTLNRSRSFNNANNSNSSNNNTTAISNHSSTSTMAQHPNSGSCNNTATSINLVTMTAVASESANAKLAQAIVLKQQQQQQQQQHQQQQQQQQPYQHMQQHQQHYQQIQQQLQAQHQSQQQKHRSEELSHQHLPPPPPNGISKHLSTAPTMKASPNAPQSTAQPHQQYRLQHLTPNILASPSRDQHLQHKEITSLAQTPQIQQNATPPGFGVSTPSSVASQSVNVPLNLSSKPKINDENSSTSAATANVASSSSGSSSSMTRKRQNIELNQTTITAPISLVEASTAAVSNATRYPPNNSIIKNLLLNARGLAIPTGEGDDAVYVCPLCSIEFRTAEDLQHHNSTYCQGASSAPISPVASPSYKFFRSNSISLNLPDLKNSSLYKKNPLSLVKLAWSQLKTKPSSLVLNRLNASQAGNSKTSTTTTTTSKNSATSTVSSAASNSHAMVCNSAAAISITPAAESVIRLIDAPLPSPGPLLGKTALVDSYNHNESHKSVDGVVITKMHEDRQFASSNSNAAGTVDADHMPSPNKRAKYNTSIVAEQYTLSPAPNGLLATSSKRLISSSVSGGDIQMLPTASIANEFTITNKEEQLKRFTSSGGCMIPISECNDLDRSPKMIRTPLLSGGSFQEVSPKPKEKDHQSKRNSALSFTAGAQLQPKHVMSALGLPTNGPQHFQFPPINSITAFNPLTLPPMPTGVVGDKVIPYVPGIPGPNSLQPQLPPPPQHLQLPPSAAQPQTSIGRTMSPNRKKTPSPMLLGNSMSPKLLTIPATDIKALSPFGGVQNLPSEFNRIPPSPALRTARNWTASAQSTGAFTLKQVSNNLEVPKKSFNFSRMADNVSPRKNNSAMATNINAPKSSPPERAEVRHFNFDNISKEPEIIMQPANRNSALALVPLHVDTTSSGGGNNASGSASASATALTSSETESTDAKKSKFLRPTSLPLKPGTFTPKRHHGITPTANTLPLISPETPRPSKSCVQLYLNGHAYTYLGLKCSTKMFYCTVNCPQPSYVAGMHKLSMYSVWQVCAENNPHPLGFKPKTVMSLYDSRQKAVTHTMAGATNMPYELVISQQTVMTPFANNQSQFYHHQLKPIALNPPTATGDRAEHSLKKEMDDSAANKKETSTTSGSSSSQLLIGGYESHEEYTYIRGRGRGRYVCLECGIRCKKPSMLKKHIRTHSDVRPYTCKHCNFSFKTKGNLTKHMQSKTHYKKCIELGINPGPMPADGEFLEPDVEFDQQSTTSAGGRTSSIPGESDSEDYTDNESESSDTDESKSRLQEHEAARCLLSLSMTPPISQSISPQLNKHDVYAYQQNVVPETNAIPLVSGAGRSSSTVASATAATITTSPTTPLSHPTTIKRVVSFTSPKPPFDYQKQEQYYSNPEESKPKRNANSAATSSYESAPMDLTKPRSMELSPVVAAPPVVSATVHNYQPQVHTSNYSQEFPSTSAGPVHQTQAQIHDVIFGSGNNESGFLKTLISVSDKVRTAAESAAENSKKINENILLQAYLTEQALQYTKIKQSQMNRSFPDSTVAMSSSSIVIAVAGAVSTATTTTSSNKYSNVMWVGSSTSNQVVTATSISSNSSALMSSSISTSLPPTTTEYVKTAVILPPEQTPKEKEMKSDQSASLTTNLTKILIKTQPIADKVNTPRKSSDEGEESEGPSDQELSTVLQKPQNQKTNTSTAKSGNSTTASTAIPTPDSHNNGKLPSAVQQPGTTDFSGVLSAPARTIIVGEDGLKKSTNNEIQPVYPRVPMSPDGRPVCTICSKTFQKQPQLVLHMNIHYMERKFKCEPCAVSFRTQGHLQKHERSEAHKNKVMMTSTFGVPTTSNPRPFECTDCKIAFRIHGHLAKHLRSKTHVQKLECLQKLPFGTYAEIERAGISLTEIDTSDCENSLRSLQELAKKLIEKDPTKLSGYTTPSGMAVTEHNTITSGGGGGGGGGGVGGGIGSQHDSASEDGFSAAASAAATAIASLDNDSAANTPKRANSMSEDEAIASGLSNNFKRHLPGSFSNGEESDNQTESEKRRRINLPNVGASVGGGSAATASTAAGSGSPASSTTSNISSN